MKKILKGLFTSISAFGALFSLLWQKIKRPANCDFLDSRIDEILVIDTGPYLNQQKQTVRTSAKDDLDLFYLKFENLFRGSKESIKTRQAVYVEYVRRAYKLSDKATYFLNVGCGRGEFLELLDAAKIPVKGLETNKIEYEALVKKGFDVEFGNCNTFLENIRDCSLAGISAFQVIEHFNPDYLQSFMKLSYERIAVNGILI